ncbi:MCE family protein [Mycolicibacterium thermoresistibile]|uniref:Virulence factor Mce family protein n=2 Tax=Mycolicibacterium thermoresistibile TaxID=1797 RepID=G7CN09_MYCT3|nr:MCE family protein [Mycolicibacterium thermoresistibile]EHI10498.1 virulence factor Mce family protein [Mycolicibacterium thermoresistibile ATCC 19527]MCV7189637.1 MCE family protein [Mycolicibacterium thermoresistibile]GAT15450.1 virulence factor Mce family protein [Mycolicibacterium thermoresistibile]SNW17509.1 virulence factor Mce family protein [Mycolicibacterium thermoresistibile]
MTAAAPVVKLGVFATVMVVLTAGLIMVFGDYRGGESRNYSAVFTDVSRLEVGDSVRIAGIRAGTVNRIRLRDDHTVVVSFDVRRDVALTTGTTAAVRYLNLVGDRYLELRDGPGPTGVLPAGAEIPRERTMPALDLDLLLGGLKPVLRSLNPEDVNSFSASLVGILQGQGGTLESLLSRTSTFTTALADNGAVVQQVIDRLQTVLATLSERGPEFAAAVERLERFITELSVERDPIGSAIEALESGSASLADLLAGVRPPLDGTVDELARLTPLLDADKDRIEVALQKAPHNYRKLVRLGAYGSFINYYFCAATIRVSDLQGRTAVFPWIRNPGARCGEP